MPGWRTNRKIVVIESDDWGTIRMASKEAYNHFLRKGFPVDECPYNKNDALESNDDLIYLFEVLSSIIDMNGNNAIITANNIVANPDFEKIRDSNFQEYFYEPFITTLKHYPKHEKVESLYREGISRNIFKPQFHGREHLNVNRWMDVLKKGDKIAHMAFDHNMFSVHSERMPQYKNEYMDALDCNRPEDIDEHIQNLKEGLELFQNIWGYKSRSFIAACYIWPTLLEPHLKQMGIEAIQGVLYQKEPILTLGTKYKIKHHYQGQKNRNGQRYLVRNVFFEPTFNDSFDWINDSMSRIEAAFRWGKPAIISAHRVNFMGYLNPVNRDKNLKLLKKLLRNIVKRWQDVEFMSTDQLTELINKPIN